MNLNQQAAIIAAAIAGEELKLRQIGATKWTNFKPHPDMTFNFKGFEYAVAKPELRVLHQYIVRMTSGNYKMTLSFYASPEEVYAKTGYRDAQPAAWTRIEVQV